VHTKAERAAQTHLADARDPAAHLLPPAVDALAPDDVPRAAPLTVARLAERLDERKDGVERLLLLGRLGRRAGVLVRVGRRRGRGRRHGPERAQGEVERQVRRRVEEEVLRRGRQRRDARRRRACRARDGLVGRERRRVGVVLGGGGAGGGRGRGRGRCGGDGRRRRAVDVQVARGRQDEVGCEREVVVRQKSCAGNSERERQEGTHRASSS